MLPLLVRKSIAASVCLLLGTLGCPWSATASPPGTEAPTLVQTQTLPVQHAAPSDILRKMGWDRPQAQLPVGIKQIAVGPGGQGLTVVGTQQGIETVQQIVDYLDVATPRVRVQFAFTRATPGLIATYDKDFPLVPDAPSPECRPASKVSNSQILEQRPANSRPR